MSGGTLLCDIWFPGKPRGKGRQNFTARPRKSGAGVLVGGIRLYSLRDIMPVPMPAKTAGYERDMQISIIQQMRKQGHFTPHAGPIRLDFCAYYPPLKSDTKKNTLAKLEGLIARMVTPDIDNVEKMICDAANTYVFMDDKQVIQSTGAKIYSKHEGIRMRFYAIEPLDVKTWADETFPWEDEEEDFNLVG